MIPGESGEAWKELKTMLEMLGPEGMSSDESETEVIMGQRKTTYHVKRQPWRARFLARNLRIIDCDRNATNAYGNAPPGNPPRDRRRVSTTMVHVSRRVATAGLPMNYYDAEWFNKLSARDRRDLHVQPAVAIVDVDM